MKVTLPPLFLFTGQWYISDIEQWLLHKFAIVSPINHHDLLIPRGAHWDHHFPARSHLMKERLWNLVSSCKRG